MVFNKNLYSSRPGFFHLTITSVEERGSCRNGVLLSSWQARDRSCNLSITVASGRKGEARVCQEDCRHRVSIRDVLGSGQSCYVLKKILWRTWTTTSLKAREGIWSTQCWCGWPGRRGGIVRSSSGKLPHPGKSPDAKRGGRLPRPANCQPDHTSSCIAATWILFWDERTWQPCKSCHDLL